MFYKKYLIFIVAMLAFNVNAELKTEDINPAVTVVWNNPENFRDVDASNGIKSKYLARVLDDFEKYFHEELPKYLKANQNIKVTVYDIDLAGDVRPMLIQGTDVRLVTSLYPPMMDLEYVITDEQGAVVKKTRKRLRDLAFDISSSAAMSGKALRHEKVMLKRWFNKELM